MAEDDDDDESFGDFTFASFPNQPLPTTLNDTNPIDDDDDWGDFVNNSNATFSKPFSPFPPSLDPPNNHVNDNTATAVHVETPKKPNGAIPLSIFGVEEEEEEEPAPANVFFNKSNVRNGSDSNGTVPISDLISNFYNVSNHTNAHNGPVSVSSNVAAPDSNAAGGGATNSSASKLDSDSEDEDGWEFKSAQWENGIKSQNVKAEVPKHDNGALVCTVLDSSNEVSDKAGEWHLEFNFGPSSALQAQPALKSELNESGNGVAMFNQNFGELNSGLRSNQNLEVPKITDTYPTGMEVLKFDGAASHGTFDSSLGSESHQSKEWDLGFNFNPSPLGEDSHSSELYFTAKNNQDDSNKNNASPANVNVDSDVNWFESNGAVTEIKTKQEKAPISSENHRGALPLSIFGDETPDTDEHSISQDLSPYAPTSTMRNNFNSPGSNLPINDLIWNLYNQAENKTSPNVTSRTNESHIHASPEVSGSSLVASNGVDDDSWDFKDASTGTRFDNDSAQETSFNHTPQIKENGLQSSPTILNFDLTNDDDDFEDDSWEFKDAISEKRSQDYAPTLDQRNIPPTQLSTKLEQIDYVEFYSKLTDELCNYVLFHLQNLKKTQSAASLLGEDGKAKALQEEIQEFSKTLHQDNLRMSIPNEYLSEYYSPRNVCFDELLEVLKETKYQSLESEYQLASRLSAAEKDMKSAMELLRDTVSTLRILKLGSREEQLNYLTTWSKLAFACSQELKHGADIWKQAVQKNVHDQILSNLNGVQYILALGEICRVAEIIGASAKLHKPWMLSGSIDPKSLCASLNEGYSIWLGSGLEEALFSISNRNNFQLDDMSRELVESIKYIHELDEHALQSHVISEGQTTCKLSALPAGFVPGLNLVTWNGEHYFVKLANLWINLISSDPPKM
ncbi:hypothetical protein RJT34_22936 [Clitoria ternatea]|uniref:Synergin gamma C-terminal domain-containing protein n=1 Tax=Clitoria ternatea TaxID=43366 RepID=A0AAN9FK08_CLITE